MTREMSDSDIAALSTGREAEFDRIMAAIRRSRRAVPGTLQHVVLYGSRGFGKSFMMRRVEIALQRESVDGEPVRFLLLPEEQHNLQKSSHALLDYIKTLLTQDDGDAAFAETMFRWPKKIGEAARRWADAAAQLEAALDVVLPHGKGLVVVAVENFDTLLATLFANEEDEQRLREWLFRPRNRLMLLATATGTVDLDYERPLFQAFEAVRLTPWTNDDCLAYFNRRRDSEGKPPLDARQEAKARAVAEFIGGTPRLAQLLGSVIDTEDALSVSAMMDALADQLADYYKRRIEDLAPLVRGLLDALIRGGEPASQTELAKRVGAEGQSQIARAMADLQRADIIRGRPALDTHETLYQVTDRVFVHYYRLRQASRSARTTPLTTILDFLRSFYSRDEQRMHGLRHLLSGRLAEGALLSRLALEGTEAGYQLFREYFEKRLRAYLTAATTDFGDAAAITARLTSEPERVLKEYAGAEADKPVDAAIRAVLRAQALYRFGHIDQAEEALRAVEETSRDDAGARCVFVAELRNFLANVRGRSHDAARYGVALADIDWTELPELLAYLIMGSVGWSLGQLGRHEEAIEMLTQAAALARQVGDKSEEAQCLCHMGWSQGQVGRHMEAIETLTRGAELARQVADKGEEAECLRLIGFSLGELSRHGEAIEALMRAAELARQVGDEWEWCHAVATAMSSAIHAPMRGISGDFAEWVRIVRARPELDAPDPRFDRINFLIGAVQADELDGYDAVIADHGDWLASEFMAYVTSEHGMALADVAAKDGRAAGWAAVAGVLPRLQRLQALAPEHLRDKTWLSDLVTGFAQGCRDPGLLRDIADLLTANLSPEAEAAATLLRDLALIDEGDDPERVLSRLDPDRALLIRRLRDLPDPEPPRGRKSAKKGRR